MTPNTPNQSKRSDLEDAPGWVVEDAQTEYGHWSSVFANVTGDKRPTTGAPLRWMTELTAQGLSRDGFERVRLGLGVSTEEMLRLTGIPKRTYSRRERFKPDESERILRLASCFHHAVVTLESASAARRWMTHPKQALDGLTPLETCRTELGAREVENLLGRIEHGVFS